MCHIYVVCKMKKKKKKNHGTLKMIDKKILRFQRRSSICCSFFLFLVSCAKRHFTFLFHLLIDFWNHLNDEKKMSLKICVYYISTEFVCSLKMDANSNDEKKIRIKFMNKRNWGEGTHQKKKNRLK